jgi:hypothetical protein
VLAGRSERYPRTKRCAITITNVSKINVYLSNTVCWGRCVSRSVLRFSSLSVVVPEGDDEQGANY